MMIPGPVEHPVPDPWLREDVAGRAGGVAKLAAQSLDHLPHQPRLSDPLRRPDPLQQMVMGQDTAGVN